MVIKNDIPLNLLSLATSFIQFHCDFLINGLPYLFSDERAFWQSAFWLIILTDILTKGPSDNRAFWLLSLLIFWLTSLLNNGPSGYTTVTEEYNYCRNNVSLAISGPVKPHLPEMHNLWRYHRTSLPCKAKRPHKLTLQVSWCCLLALQGSIGAIRSPTPSPMAVRILRPCMCDVMLSYTSKVYKKMHDRV